MKPDRERTLRMLASDRDVRGAELGEAMDEIADLEKRLAEAEAEISRLKAESAEATDDFGVLLRHLHKDLEQSEERNKQRRKEQYAAFEERDTARARIAALEEALEKIVTDGCFGTSEGPATACVEIAEQALARREGEKDE